MECMIESQCPWREKCQLKDQAEFCAYHRDNYAPPPPEKCPIHPSCHYASICDISTESERCRQKSSPPI